jgi:ribosomal protein S18 acetylase RimI-like enzyme
MKKKKSAAAVGTVLRTLKDESSLKPWAEFLASIEPWNKLGITATTMLERWTKGEAPWRFFSAADARTAKSQGFDFEHGIIAFSESGAKAIITRLMKAGVPEQVNQLPDGGYVQSIGAKSRKKGVGKYLLGAAERVVSEKSPVMYLFVSEGNTGAQRFYKSQGYEEIARASDCLQAGNTEILMIKRLVS